MAKKQPKRHRICDRCNDALAVYRERFCPRCRKQVLAELKEAGYLSDMSIRTPNGHLNRKTRSSNALGGCAELRSDGDAW